MAEYEYIVIGSGIAATLVIKTILEKEPSSSILVLEAGERIQSRDRRAWWDIAFDDDVRPYTWTYDAEAKHPETESFSLGNTDFLFTSSRVRAYGGSTMHWGGWSLRFKGEDFHCKTNTGRGADWPFDYDHLEPWYQLAESELSVSGTLDDGGPARKAAYPMPPFPWSLNETDLAKSFEKHGLLAGHMPIARYSRCMTTGTCKYCPIGSRYTSQDTLEALEANTAYKNLKVVTQAPVVRLDAEKTVVRGVTYRNMSDPEPKKHHDLQVLGDNVIICAGAYESPKLLLRSKSPDWPLGVGNKNDQVGRYLVTHTLFYVRGERANNPDIWNQEYDFPTLMSRSWDTPENQAKGKVFLFNDRSRPDVDIAELMIDGKSRNEIETSIKTAHRAVGLSAFIEEFGEFHNRITLGKGTGKFGLPHSHVEFTRSSDLEPTIKTYSKRMQSILESVGVSNFRQKAYDPRGDHTSGTCRMGTAPDNSVTDCNLRVHGVENLYVCSNAVLPNAAAVNPTLTLAALSLRLGAHLAPGKGAN